MQTKLESSKKDFDDKNKALIDNTNLINKLKDFKTQSTLNNKIEENIQKDFSEESDMSMIKEFQSTLGNLQKLLI